MAWQNPKTDWAVNPKNPVPEDFNRIEGNIDFLKQDIETKKGIIVDALNTVGLDTELTDTHAQIANKITDANQGTKIITPSTTNQIIPKGFHTGDGYVVGDADLVASKIKYDVKIFNIIGTFGKLQDMLINPSSFTQAEIDDVIANEYSSIISNTQALAAVANSTILTERLMANSYARAAVISNSAAITALLKNKESAEVVMAIGSASRTAVLESSIAKDALVSTKGGCHCVINLNNGDFPLITNDWIEYSPFEWYGRGVLVKTESTCRFSSYTPYHYCYADNVLVGHVSGWSGDNDYDKDAVCYFDSYNVYAGFKTKCHLSGNIRSGYGAGASIDYYQV